MIDESSFEILQSLTREIFCAKSSASQELGFNPANETAKKIADKLSETQILGEDANSNIEKYTDNVDKSTKSLNKFKNISNNIGTLVATGNQGIVNSVAAVSNSHLNLGGVVDKTSGKFKNFASSGIDKLNESTQSITQNFSGMGGIMDKVVGISSVLSLGFDRQTASTVKNVAAQQELMESIIENNREYSALQTAIERVDSQIKNLQETSNKGVKLAFADKELKELHNNLSGLVDDLNKNSEEGTKLKESFNGIGEAGKQSSSVLISGLKTASKEALNFIKSLGPIGIALAIITAAIGFLVKAFTRTEEGGNKLGQAIGRVSGIVSAFFKFIQPAVDALVGGFIKVFDFVTRMIPAFGRAADAGQKLVKMEQEYAKALRDSEKLKEKYEYLAERQRQVRDDETKSIAQRINANKQLGVILDQQLQKELNVARLQIAAAVQRIKVEGLTTEALDAKAGAEAKWWEVQNRIAGQKSEQIQNEVSIRQEASNKYIEIYDKELAALRAAEDAKIALMKEGIKKEIILSNVSYNRQIEDLRLRLKRESDLSLAARKAINNNIMYLQKERDKAIQDIYKQHRDEILNNYETFGLSELGALQIQYNKEQELLKKALKDKIISQKEYYSVSDRLAKKYIKDTNDVLYGQKQRDIEYDAEKHYLDILNSVGEATVGSIFKWGYKNVNARRLVAEENLNVELKSTQDQLDNLNTRRNKAAENGEDLKEIDAAIIRAKIDIRDTEDKLADISSKREKEKISLVRGTFADMTEIFDEHTKFTKGAKSAEVAIDSYTGANAVFNQYQIAFGAPLGSILGGVAAAATIAKGAAAIKNIWKVDKNASNLSSSTSTASIVPPQIQQTKSVLTNTEVDLQAKSTKVYVVESDITSAQNKVSVAQNEATF